MRRFSDGMREIAHRFWLALIIILWGQVETNALSYLKVAMSELRYIEEHWNDMTKDELLKFILGEDGKPQSGMVHNFAHAMQSEIWLVLGAAKKQVEFTELKIETVKKIKEIVAKNGG